MNYTIVKQWKTMDGGYFSSTVNKKDYDSAVGEFHSMFKPLQNDPNVAYFRLSLMDEYGSATNPPTPPVSWTRQTKPVE